MTQLAADAIVALVSRDRECDDLLARLSGADRVAISLPVLTEATRRLGERFGLRGRAAVALLREHDAIEVIPYDEAHHRIAASAAIRFGEHRPAGLGPFECMTYAAARIADEPVLSLGGGLALTDVRIAGE